MKEKVLGIIGGSGLYKMDGLEFEEEREVDTPFGKPSDALVIGRLEGVKVIFLPRHGRGHRILPSEINYRANIYALKKLGAEFIIGSGACGSLREHLQPGFIVVIDQFIDRTTQRVATFMGGGVVGHLVFADPICPVLSSILYESAKELGIRVQKGGTYICIEGPSFSTRAESELYRQWGADVIGMTNLTEAKLAKEAELCYAVLALVTDYDSWHKSEEPVTIEMVLKVMNQNIESCQRVIREAVKRLPEKRSCSCTGIMKNAIITEQGMIPESRKRELDLIVGKYLKKE